jgi:CHAT domain-containing protein
VIDQRHPDRSAILLAPGSSAEDGLLQVREVSELRLDGTMVVLSSCQSATGTVTRGEGVMGLARAFFEAGAHTVIGSLWPVRDDHARDFFGRFYAHLGRGVPAGEALRSAQSEARADGLPADAWAGMVLIGDGLAIVADSTRTAGTSAVVSGLAIALALVFVALALRWHVAGRHA